jgi:hypothetical protein
MLLVTNRKKEIRKSLSKLLTLVSGCLRQHPGIWKQLSCLLAVGNTWPHSLPGVEEVDTRTIGSTSCITCVAQCKMKMQSLFSTLWRVKTTSTEI